MDSYRSRGPRARVSRRGFLRGTALAAAGLGGAALIGCSGDDDDAATPAGTGTGGTASPSSTAAPGGAVRGGSYTIGIQNQPDGFDPDTGVGQDERFERVIYDQMIFQNREGDFDLSRSVIEEFEITDNTHYTFKVRPGVKFHDGTEVNADTIKWNIDRHRDPGRTTSSSAAFEIVTATEVVDDHTVTMTLSQPNSGLLAWFGDNGGMLLPPHVVEDIGIDDFNRRPVGTGPFRFTSWTDETEIVYEAVPDHWRASAETAPFLDEIRLRFIPDAVVLPAALQAGEIDMIEEPFQVFAELLNDPDIELYKNPGPAIVNLVWNHGLAPLDDTRFRQACAYAFDREQFNQIFYSGQNPPIESIIPVGSWAYEPQPNYPKFDLQKAQQLIDATGIPEADRKFKIGGTSRVWGGPDAVSLFAADMAKIGVEVTYEATVPPGGGAVTSGGDGSYMVATGSSCRADPDVQFRSSYTEATNRWRAPLPNFDESLLDKAVEVFEREERREYYVQMQEILAEELYNNFAILDRAGWTYHRKDANVAGIDYLWYSPLWTDLRKGS